MIFFDYKGEEVSSESKNIVAKQLFFEETQTHK